MILKYDRVVRCEVSGKTEIVAEHATSAHSVAMPDDVEEVEPNRWQRKRVTKALTVLETWRIEAA